MISLHVFFISYFKNIILTFSTIHLTAFLKNMFILARGVSVHTYHTAGREMSVHTHHRAGMGEWVFTHTTQVGRGNECACTPHSWEWGDERALMWLSFLLLPCGSQGNELRSSDLAASSFIHSANSPALHHASYTSPWLTASHSMRMHLSFSMAALFPSVMFLLTCQPLHHLPEHHFRMSVSLQNSLASPGLTYPVRTFTCSLLASFL